MPTDESKPLAPRPVSDYEELKDSEERLQAFMNHSPILAFMKDDEGRYVYVNPKMESTFRISLDEIRGKADFDWLPDDVARTVRENDRRVLSTGETVESLESVGTPEGIRHWMVVKFPFNKPDGRVFVGGVAVDVTTLHVTRESLSNSERRYRHLVESSQGLICTHDVEGRLLSVNPAALRVLGYSVDEIVGRDMRELLPPPVRPEFEQYLERINTKRTDTGLMLIMGKDGAEHVWQYHNVKITEPGEAAYVLGHAQDVTELRIAQEQLRRLSLTDELTGVRTGAASSPLPGSCRRRRRHPSRRPSSASSTWMSTG
jgi:PAS domain S-box-containing protein